MEENKSSISKASTYREIGEYWDTHELPEDAPEVEFIVKFDPDPHHFDFEIESSVSDRLRTVATRRGISAETLLNIWVKEKLDSDMVRT
ncbi:MAG: hypothetical protein ABL999_13860 [Pyrinomonadaceae bacterium]